MRKLTWMALIVYSAVILALTMLKAYYRIGYLWDPAVHHHRGVRLIPFDDLINATGWFKPTFEYAGNIAFFIPFGVLVYMLTRSVTWTVLIGGLASLTIEISQYIFALGYTDIDDLAMNTLGALIGALIAKWAGDRWHKMWIALALLASVVFAVLVVLGERLGDPNTIVPNTHPQSTHGQDAPAESSSD